MKIIVSCCLLVIVCTPTTAQKRVGAFGGITVSTMGSKDLVTTKILASPYLGLMADSRIGKSDFYLGAELSYISMGYTKSNLGAVDETGTIVGTINRYAISYLQLPVMLSVSAKISEKNNFRFGFGPYLALKVADKIKYISNGAVASGEIKPMNIKDASSTVVGISAKLSVDIAKLQVAIKYQPTINSIYTSNIPGDKWKAKSLSLSLGYFFK